MSDELNLENLDAVPAEEPVVEASEAAADEAAAPVEPVADLSAESDASVDNADVESDAPAATESAPVASTQTETVSLDEDEEEVNESEQAEETDAGQQAVDEFSKSLRSLDGKWYVLHTYSGYEKRVKTNIESRVASFGMEDQIFQVEVPMEEVEKHTEKGKKVITRVRVPGYVLIRMWPDENARRIVRETEGVTGFVGPDSKPVALTPAEVDMMLSTQQNSVEFGIAIGEEVRILSGPLENFTGVVEDVDTVRQKLTVKVKMFLGREMPVEVDLQDVEKVQPK